MQEVWKDVEGFEGLYQISNRGRLKSFKQSDQGIILKTEYHTNGYFTFVLCSQKENKRRTAKIHKLVATAFVPNPLNLKEVNHKDGNKHNNRADNLEWVTHKENITHSMRILHTHQNDSMINYNKFIRPKEIVQMDLEGNIIDIFPNAVSASEKTGVCARNILQVASKTPFNQKGLCRKTAGGFKWAFKSEVM